jgi:hypothetical protein
VVSSQGVSSRQSRFNGHQVQRGGSHSNRTNPPDDLAKPKEDSAQGKGRRRPWHARRLATDESTTREKTRPSRGNLGGRSLLSRAETPEQNSSPSLCRSESPPSEKPTPCAMCEAVSASNSSLIARLNRHLSAQVVVLDKWAVEVGICRHEGQRPGQDDEYGGEEMEWQPEPTTYVALVPVPFISISPEPGKTGSEAALGTRRCSVLRAAAAVVLRALSSSPGQQEHEMPSDPGPLDPQPELRLWRDGGDAQALSDSDASSMPPND